MRAANPTSAVNTWLAAIRPKTLPAGAMPVVLGSAVAFADGVFAVLPAVVACVCAVLMQIMSNLLNDLYDFRRGADNASRLGPQRVVAAGLLSEQAVVRAAWCAGGLAFVLGQYLVWVGGWQILAIGLVSLVAAWAYTGGPAPLAYLGLGELCAFVFFGVVPVCGTYFLQAHVLTVHVVLFSMIPGFLSANILMTNNIRDIQTDAAAGKRTLPVRVGIRAARVLYVVWAAAALAVPVSVWLAGGSPWLMLGAFAVPSGVVACRALYASTSAALNNVLFQTVKLLIISCVLVSGGLVMSRIL